MPRLGPRVSAMRAGCATACPRRTAARCRRSIRARCASRARRSPTHDGLADFAFAMQGLGSGAITLAGSRRAEGALAAARRRGRGDRGVRAVGAGRRLRRRGADDARAPRRRRAGSSTAARRGSRTAASPTSTACCARTGEAAGTRGISAFVVPADAPGLVVAERIEVDRAASARAARVRRLPRPGAMRCSAPKARASSSRCARSTSSARRSPPPRSASRAARSTKSLRHARAAPDVRRARSPTCSSRRRRSATWRRRSMPRRCSPIAPRGCATCAATRDDEEAAMAKLTATESAQRVIDARCSCFGGLGVTRGRGRRAALPRDPRAAHLRRRDRGAEAHRRRANCLPTNHRGGAADGHARTSTRSRATTCRRATQWPELVFELPELALSGAAQLPRPSCSTAPSSAAGAIAIGDPRARRAALDLCASCSRRRTASRTCWSRTWDSCPATACCCAAPNNPMMRRVLVRRAQGGRHRGGDDAAAAREGADRHRHQGARSRTRCATRGSPTSSTPRGRGCPTLTSRRAIRRPAPPDGSRRGWRRKAATLRRRRHRGRRHRAHRVHVGHHRHAEGDDALPSRLHRRVRLLAARTCCARRRTTSSPAARRSRSRSAWAACCCFRCASARRRC